MDSKRCSTCRQDLPLDAFARQTASRDGRQPKCRACWRDWYLAHKDGHVAEVRRRNALRTQDNRARLVAYLEEHPCVDCGESDLRVLDFDHRDRTTKGGLVSTLVFRASWARVEREIALCDVRCANCHRRRTAQQLGWWSARPDEPTERDRAGQRLLRVLSAT